ncbi:MAG: DUF4167 domain-containing protein [Rhodobacteraceae bacterium]|nr:DUF4167 domain-containing protein [Paracoccaceae bacterium]
MRSSKQRSRSKQNRNRSVGNVVNRVFDSSGPEGKVRGTPQQIIEKYNQLARDAQLGGDQVATENFQQHAEHYTRMLAEATREQEARREAQEAQHRERQQQRAADREERAAGGGEQPQQPHHEAAPQPAGAPPEGMPQPVVELGEPVGGVIDVNTGGDNGLVETPESKPAPKSRSRRPRRKPEPPAGDSGGSGKAEAAE